MSNYRDDSELAAVNRQRGTARRGRSARRCSAVLQAAQRVSAQRRRLRRHGRAAGAAVGIPRQDAARADRRGARRGAAARRLSQRPSSRQRRTVPLHARQADDRSGRHRQGLRGRNRRRRRCDGTALDGFIDAGGNQYFVGLPPGKAAWTVGIKNPIAAGQLLGVVEAPARRGVDVGRLRRTSSSPASGSYGHMLDPRTLRPSTAALSVTILSRDGTLRRRAVEGGVRAGPEGWPRARRFVSRDGSRDRVSPSRRFRRCLLYLLLLPLPTIRRRAEPPRTPPSA